MRVIAGTARGRTLRAPTGNQTRPTSDQVREALFNLLGAAVPRATAVLDLYAGSGALGIEALSRGAGRADFVESRRAACTAIRANLAATGLAGQSRIFCRPVERVLPDLEPPYDIILADPPYADPARDRVLSILAEAQLLSCKGLLVLEHSRHHPVAESYGRLAWVRDRRYGDTMISIFHQGEQS